MSSHDWEHELGAPLAAPEIATTLSIAWAEAEARAAEREARAAARADALAEEMVYTAPKRERGVDITPFPPAMYRGTGIGALYGLSPVEGFDFGEWAVSA